MSLCMYLTGADTQFSCRGKRKKARILHSENYMNMEYKKPVSPRVIGQ